MNVRWDAVVDRSKMIRAEAVDPSAQPSNASPTAAPTPNGMIAVEIWLFGQLQPANLERPLLLSLPAPATAGQILHRLGERLGPAFLAKIVDENGAKQGPCRLFVEGQAIDDLAQPIAQGAQPTRIELILLMAAEGG